jgi:1,2-phenylacetyl-CoA epoxidase catalytic subunit
LRHHRKVRHLVNLPFLNFRLKHIQQLSPYGSMNLTPLHLTNGNFYINNKTYQILCFHNLYEQLSNLQSITFSSTSTISIELISERFKKAGTFHNFRTRTWIRTTSLSGKMSAILSNFLHTLAIATQLLSYL